MDKDERMSFQIVLFSILMVTGIIGNSLVIYVYTKAKNRKRFLKFERMILILAIVDLIASTLNPAFYIYQIKVDYRQWHFGYLGCKIIPAVGPIFSSISLGLILLMAIDRDRAVCTPFKQQFSLSLLYKAIAVTVILAIVVNVPYMHYLGLIGPTSSSCLVDRIRSGISYPRAFVTVTIISDLFFLSIFLVTTIRVCYKLMYKSTDLTYPKTREFRERETKRILKMIVCMGVFFIVLIFPRDIFLTILYLTFLHPPYLRVENAFMVNAVLKVLYTSNSVVNVFMYSVLNRRFRRDLFSVFMQYQWIRQISGYTSEDSSYYSEDGSTRRFSSRKQSNMIQSKRQQVLHSISVFKTEVCSMPSSLQPSLQTSPVMKPKVYVGDNEYLHVLDEDKKEGITTPTAVHMINKPHISDDGDGEDTINQTINTLNILSGTTPHSVVDMTVDGRSSTAKDFHNPIFGEIKLVQVSSTNGDDNNEINGMNERSPML